MANPEFVKKMEHFGISGSTALGIPNSMLKPYAKTIGKNQSVAEQLWDVDIHEAKLVAILLMEPQEIKVATAEKMISELYSWDLCDGLGMKILPKTSFGLKKISEWASREQEFEKRVAFATMVGAILDRKIPDSTIESFFPIIEKEAWDDRNFVKKGINWALRQAGKRNLTLNKSAIESAMRIQAQETKSAKWIANDALRELRSEVIQERLEKKQKRRAD